MTVTIVNDSCGSAGIYHRINKLLNEETLKLGLNVEKIIIHAACDYDELSFSTEDNGGCYTHEKFETGNVVMHNELVHNTAGPNRTQIWLWLRKPGVIKGTLFR